MIEAKPVFGQRYEYKNAANVYTETDYTPAHREATTHLVQSLYGTLTADIAERRKMQPEALRRLIDGAPTDAFNLGTGTGTSVRAILAATAAATGLTVPVRYGPRRAGDPPSLVADMTKSKGVLGFRPRFTEIGEIVETAWRWHRKRWSA